MEEHNDEARIKELRLEIERHNRLYYAENIGAASPNVKFEDSLRILCRRGKPLGDNHC